MARPRDTDVDDDEPTMISGGPAAAPKPAEPPPIEVVLSRQAQTIAAADARATASRYRMLEVWTRNRVYIVDSALECIEVIDRRSGKSETTHSLIGASLVGGQRKYTQTMHISRPFPVPGTEAIFVRPGKRAQPSGLTSKVERVVLHVHIASVAMVEDAAAWDDVTSHLLQNRLGLQRE
jgi:hypothetical protein